jgi:hypothetical protein
MQHQKVSGKFPTERPTDPKSENCAAVGTATGAKSKSQSQRNNRKAENSEQASRRRNGNAATCATCGERLRPKRGSRRQRHCSYRCRDEARRARNFAVSAATRRGSAAIPRPVENNGVGSTACEGNFHGRACGIVGPRGVFEIGVVGRRKWREVVSADGVRVWVAQLSPSAAP